MKLKSTALIALAVAALSPLAWAGRPLASDDAATADEGTCQVESWLAGGQDHSWVVAPACALGKGLELDLDYTHHNPRDEVLSHAGVALKWVPEAARVATPLGEINFGVKLGNAFVHPAGGRGWSGEATTLLGLATLNASEDWAVHANLGPVRDRETGMSATLLNLALVWTPCEPSVLFVETKANDRKSLTGQGTLNTAGTRWWVVKDRFGLDLTASREAGSNSGTRWSVGFGWYGIGL